MAVINTRLASGPPANDWYQHELKFFAKVRSGRPSPHQRGLGDSGNWLWVGATVSHSNIIERWEETFTESLDKFTQAHLLNSFGTIEPAELSV